MGLKGGFELLPVVSLQKILIQMTFMLPFQTETFQIKKKTSLRMTKFSSLNRCRIRLVLLLPVEQQ